MSLFPTLTRMWMLRGRQRRIRAPGVHPPKRHECAATDWRTGTLVRVRTEKRNVAALLARYGRHLTLRYPPSYAPECMPIERLWNDWRDNVTHNHDRDDIHALEADSDRYFARCNRHPQRVLHTIGSPFAHRSQRCKK